MAAAGAGDAAAGDDTRPAHAATFKLRFAAVREPGRSYVSLVKPRALPATVTGKFYARDAAAGEGEEDGERLERAVRRVRDMFTLGPRDKLPAPALSSHEYGWWSAAGGGGGGGTRDPRLHHHLRDSEWLRARLRVLAADARAKPPAHPAR